jgi:hypothetical protein
MEVRYTVLGLGVVDAEQLHELRHVGIDPSCLQGEGREREKDGGRKGKRKEKEKEIGREGKRRER